MSGDTLLALSSSSIYSWEVLLRDLSKEYIEFLRILIVTKGRRARKESKYLLS